MIEHCDFPIDPNNSRVFLFYSRYWHFCKYSEKYEPEHVAEQKKVLFWKIDRDLYVESVEVLLPRVGVKKNGHGESYGWPHSIYY